MRPCDNPFAVDRVLNVRYELAGGDLEALVQRFARLGHRAAIVGPHGTGKTTLVEDLERPLAARGFRITRLRLDRERRRFDRATLAALSATLGAGDLVCLDGAEQLNAARWMAFRYSVRRAGALLITTHKPGRLSTLIECTTSVQLLDRIVRRLTLGTDARLAAVRTPHAEELFTRHRGNLRDALRELYDTYADAA